MSDSQLLNTIGFILTICDAIIFFIFAFIFLKRASKRDDAKKFFMAATILFLGFGIRIILGILDLMLNKEFVLIIFLSNMVLFIATIPLCFHVEKTVFKKTKLMLSYSAIALFVVFVVVSIISNFSRPVMYFWVIPPFIIVLFIWAIGYLFLIIKSTGSVRTSSILIFVGSAVIIVIGFLHGIYGTQGQNPIPVFSDYFEIIALIIPWLELGII